MIRKIIVIDEEKCNGCGACAAACHEGAIGMVNGKTAAGRLLRRAWRLPAGMSRQCHLIHPSGGRCLRRKGGAGEQACSPAGSTSPPRRRMSRHTHAANAPEKSHRGCTADFRRIPAGTVAVPDSAGSGACALLSGYISAHRSGLHCLRLRCHASNISAWENYVNRMPQAGRCQLCRKADTDSPQQ